MSTAVAAGVSPAHGGFRRSGSGKPDPEEADRMRNANGFFSVPDEEEEEEEEHEHGEAAVAARREEEEALSEASSIGAASSDSSSIGENSASDKEDEEEEEEVESKVQGLGMVGLATLESLEDALPTNIY